MSIISKIGINRTVSNGINPFVFNIADKIPKNRVNIPWLIKNLGVDKYPYRGIRRYGEDSSTEYMDLKYYDVKGGDCFHIKRGGQICIAKITNMCRNILFYKIIETKEEGYIDCGACSNDPNYKYHAIPKGFIYPMTVIVPDWVDISDWHLPIETEIINSHG